METGRITIKLGCPVVSSEGTVGKVEGVLVDTPSRRITHLLVKPLGLLKKPLLVSIESVVAQREQTIPWIEEVYLDTATPKGQAASLSPSSVAITRKTKVGPTSLGGGGELGNASYVLANPKTHHLTHLVVRKGGFFGKKFVVPMEWSQEITPQYVLLNMTPERLVSLSEYRTDKEIVLDVRQEIDRYAPFGAADRYGIVVEAEGGLVELTGNVRFPSAKEEAERLARSVRGVLGVRNLLKSDRELELEVAQALGKDPRTLGHKIMVRAFLGRVTLMGSLPTQETVDAALEIARFAHGVREVKSELSLEASLPQPVSPASQPEWEKEMAPSGTPPTP